MTQKNDDECMAVDLVNQMDDAISKLQIYAKHLHFAMRLHYISLCIHLLLLYIPMVMTWNCLFFFRVTGTLIVSGTTGRHGTSLIQRASNAGFGIFTDVRIKKLLNKHSSLRWFDMPMPWRPSDVTVMLSTFTCYLFGVSSMSLRIFNVHLLTLK